MVIYHGTTYVVMQVDLMTSKGGCIKNIHNMFSIGCHGSAEEYKCYVWFVGFLKISCIYIYKFSIFGVLKRKNTHQHLPLCFSSRKD